MALKFFALVALATTVRGEVVGATAAVPVPVLTQVSDATYDPFPQYYFGYNVQDTLTGDSKSQIERRNGDIVLGQYSLNDPDGTRRIVDYTSDSINGFNAVVQKVPLALVKSAVARVAATPIVEPVAAKTVAAPLVAKVESSSAKTKSASLVKTAPTPATPVAKAATAVATQAVSLSEEVVAKSSPDVPSTSPAVTSPAPGPAPVAYTAQALPYSTFITPLAVALW